MKQIIISSWLFLCVSANAQSLIDKDIEQIAYGALAEGISYCPEESFRYAGVVVMEVATGNIVANMSLFYKDGEFIKNIYGNMQPVPSGLGRSVLYLAMMPQAEPSMVIDTGDGGYVDSSGCTITDHNHKRGGFGVMNLKLSYIRNSDIGMLNAAEKVWGKDMKKLSEAILRTSINLGGRVSTGYSGRWQSHDVLGYSTTMSLLQQMCWINAVAGGKLLDRTDEKDTTTPYGIIKKSEALDSLRSAMRECVVEGMGRIMNSDYVSVAGITNVSQEDADGYKGLFAAAFFPYEKPEYTIGVYILRKGNKGYANPSYAAKNIIEWMALNKLSSQHLSINTSKSNIKHKDDWMHPAAR